MCDRFTVKATWAEIVSLYRLTMIVPPHNLRPRYNACPTDPVDVVTTDAQVLPPLRKADCHQRRIQELRRQVSILRGRNRKSRSNIVGSTKARWFRRAKA